MPSFCVYRCATAQWGIGRFRSRRGGSRRDRASTGGGRERERYRVEVVGGISVPARTYVLENSSTVALNERIRTGDIGVASTSA